MEAFVYGRSGLTFWLEKGREEARPVLDRLIAQGVSLIEGSFAARVTAASREALDAGPAPFESEQLNVRHADGSPCRNAVEFRFNYRCVLRAVILRLREAGTTTMLAKVRSGCASRSSGPGGARWT